MPDSSPTRLPEDAPAVAGAPAAAGAPPGRLASEAVPETVVRRLRRVFLESFSALDIAEDLCSFDEDRPSTDVLAFMNERGFDLIGVRQAGVVTGYAPRIELTGGLLGGHRHPFGPDDLVSGSASLSETIRSLHVNGRCFVTVLDRVGAIVTVRDLEKPAVRMWLFGMITVLEMVITRRIRAAFPGDAWSSYMSPERLSLASALRDERLRRGQTPDLLDCVQFADKATIFLKEPGLMDAWRFRSQREAKKVFKDLQSLRNNLAHTQEFIATDWDIVVRLSNWIEGLVGPV